MMSPVRVGDRGPGVPSALILLKRAGRLFARRLRHGADPNVTNPLRAHLWNLWRFHFARPFTTDKVQCPFCGYSGPAFLARGDWLAMAYDSVCPGCDARSRHRGLRHVLPGVLRRAPDGPILSFAPEPVLLDWLRTVTSRAILTTDYDMTSPVTYPGEDIQRLTLPDRSVAVILCNHVLEHIPDDRAALRECARVLQPGGLAVFTIPGDFPAQTTRTFPVPDLNGHYRHYGLDVITKMRESFTHVEAINMHALALAKARVREDDMAFLCRQ